MKYFLSLVFTLLALSSCVSEDTKVDPAQSKIHYDLALELAQYSLYQNALEEFDLAIKFDPGNINAYRKKGLVKFGLKQYEEAEKLFNYLLELEITSRLRSSPVTEFVMEPTDIMSTPVLAYAMIFLEEIPPDASSFTLLRIFFLRSAAMVLLISVGVKLSSIFSNQ